LQAIRAEMNELNAYVATLEHDRRAPAFDRQSAGSADADAMTLNNSWDARVELTDSHHDSFGTPASEVAAEAPFDDWASNRLRAMMSRCSAAACREADFRVGRELVPTRWGTRPLAEITSLAMLRHADDEPSGSSWTSESNSTWLSGFVASDSKSTSLAWSPPNSEATALRSELARLFNLPELESASSTSADWPAEPHSRRKPTSWKPTSRPRRLILTSGSRGGTGC